MAYHEGFLFFLIFVSHNKIMRTSHKNQYKGQYTHITTLHIQLHKATKKTA